MPDNRNNRKSNKTEERSSLKMFGYYAAIIALMVVTILMGVLMAGIAGGFATVGLGEVAGTSVVAGLALLTGGGIFSLGNKFLEEFKKGKDNSDNNRGSDKGRRESGSRTSRFPTYSYEEEIQEAFLHELPRSSMRPTGQEQASLGDNNTPIRPS